MATYDQTNPEIIGLAEQKALAKSLRELGMKQNLQGQMISGRFVGASPLQGLADLLNIHTGKTMERDIAQKEKDILQAQQFKQNANLQQGLNEFYGTPEFVQQGPTPTGGNIPVQAATQPDKRLALATLLSPQGGETSKAIASKIAEQEFAGPKMHNVTPGGALVDEKTGKVIYQAPYRPLKGEDGGGDGVMGSNVNNNGVPVGKYDKMGRYRAPTGTVYSAKAVDEARAEHDTATDLAYKLNQLSGDDINNAYGSLTDYTTSKVGRMAGPTKTLDAQTKVNNIGINNTLTNLSKLKGASSDKEMAQMIKDFPGYEAPPSVMQNWVERAAKTTNRFLKRSEGRFGFDTDFAEEGRFGQKPKEQKGEIAAPGAPKAGEIRQGYRFKGGDQYDQNNWEKVK